MPVLGSVPSFAAVAHEINAEPEDERPLCGTLPPFMAGGRASVPAQSRRWPKIALRRRGNFYWEHPTPDRTLKSNRQTPAESPARKSRNSGMCAHRTEMQCPNAKGPVRRKRKMPSLSRGAAIVEELSYNSLSWFRGQLGTSRGLRRHGVSVWSISSGVMPLRPRSRTRPVWNQAFRAFAKYFKIVRYRIFEQAPASECYLIPSLKRA